MARERGWHITGRQTYPSQYWGLLQSDIVMRWPFRAWKYMNNLCLPPKFAILKLIFPKSLTRHLAIIHSNVTTYRYEWARGCITRAVCDFASTKTNYYWQGWLSKKYWGTSKYVFLYFLNFPRKMWSLSRNKLEFILQEKISFWSPAWKPKGKLF